MRVVMIGVAFMLLGGCRGGHVSDTAAATADPSLARAVAQRLAGCYLLQRSNAAPYRLQLTSDGNARFLDLAARENSAGDQWRWSAQSDSAFSISLVGD